MAKHTLSELLALPDPLFSDNFRIEIPQIPVDQELLSELVDSMLNKWYLGPVGAAIGAGSFLLGLSSKGDPAGLALSIHCKSASLPAKTIEPSVVELSGHKVKYAGLANFNGTFDIEFHEDQFLTVTRILHLWMDMVKSHLTQAGHFKGKESDSGLVIKGGKKGDSCPIQLIVFDTKGIQTGAFNINGAWPCDISNIGFDGSGANPITVSASFCFDSWEDAQGG